MFFLALRQLSFTYYSKLRQLELMLMLMLMLWLPEYTCRSINMIKPEIFTTALYCGIIVIVPEYNAEMQTYVVIN